MNNFQNVSTLKKLKVKEENRYNKIIGTFNHEQLHKKIQKMQIYSESLIFNTALTLCNVDGGLHDDKYLTDKENANVKMNEKKL